MDFKFRLWNRKTYPTKHILICEDNIENQKRFMNHFAEIFDSEGHVQISLVSGSLAASAIISYTNIDLIILDHDLPEGNGSDLIKWMKDKNINIPIITASGIHQNNVIMGELGAQYYCFNKENVINGDVDFLIKHIVRFDTEPKGVAEYYINKFAQPSNIAPYAILSRYWITPSILIGGNICSSEEFLRMKEKYNIEAVINVDAGNSDAEYDINNLLELSTEDNGTPFSKENILQAIEFANVFKDKTIYLHCHLGFSRSPHFAYLILRSVYGMDKDSALNTVINSLPTNNHAWGFNQHTQSYITSIDTVLDELNKEV